MNFENINKVYDKLYVDKKYDQEYLHVKNLISKYNPGTNILEYGSGTGKYSKFFINDNFNLTGIELSPEMHQIALKKGIDSINFNMVDFVSKNTFNNAVALFHVFSYLNSEDEINIFFKNLNKNLDKNSLFIFDVWHTPAVNHISPSVRTKEFEDDNFKIKRTSYPHKIKNSNIIKVDFICQIFDKASGLTEEFNESHKMRHFSVSEIESMALKFKFKLLTSEELVSKKNPSNETWAILHVLQKL